MKTITIYELLGMIKDNNAPKKIRQGCEYYEFLEENNDYLQKGSESYCLFSDKYDIALACRLNDEVEIIEGDKEQKKIEKIKVIGCNVEVNEILFGTNTPVATETCICKINELIDIINEMKEGK